MAGAPIDGFGVGTALTTSEDAPAMDCAYKLQEYAAIARRKLPSGKATWPGRKQVFRRYDGHQLKDDTLTVAGDRQDGEPLIGEAMRGGRRTAPPERIEAMRNRCADDLGRLPPALRQLMPEDAYPVQVSQSLRDLAAKVDRAIAAMRTDERG
jgi:nicotinate phosphoribosyltransferase